MIDIVNHIGAIGRAVEAEPGSETATVTLERRYDAEPADVWEALTDPARISRWFLPISGELHEGGNFSLEGNAGGDILTCRPPERLVVTFGGPTSVVEVRLAADGDGTLLVMQHAVPMAMAGSAAGAIYVGPGWDGVLMGLALYLVGEAPEDPVAVANSIEGQQFCAASIDAWTTVLEVSSTADAVAIAEARRVSLAQFAPELV